MRKARIHLALLATVSGLLVALVLPAAVSGKPAPARPGKLAVGVEVLRFASAGRSLTAQGVVTAVLTDNAGRSTVVKQPIALSAATGGGCRVLHLFLKELTLNLLGLNAHLDQVTLDITGNARGGVLGSLFCRLANARIASARASAASALSAGVAHSRGHALRFTASLNPTASASQAAGTVCPVLDLVVGPLNLNLLGLQVDLQRVHLNVTATRGQGKLGDLFCGLADK